MTEGQGGSGKAKGGLHKKPALLLFMIEALWFYFA